jgi:hypothetical protein
MSESKDERERESGRTPWFPFHHFLNALPSLPLLAPQPAWQLGE